MRRNRIDIGQCLSFMRLRTMVMLQYARRDVQTFDSYRLSHRSQPLSVKNRYFSCRII